MLLRILLLLISVTSLFARNPESMVEGQSYLTGGFGEARGSRFHAGIDLSVGGVQGREIHSPVDGEVVRIAASYYGYGKQLLIRDAAGQRHLFAHLLDFRPDMEAWLLEKQLDAMDYAQSLNPPAGMFRVTAGELIARAGDSGSGPPHLHYELRSAENHPLNPLTHGWAVADDRAPELEAIAFCPSRPGSRVEGSLLPLVLKDIAPGDTILAQGPIRLSLAARDRSTRSRGRLPVHSLLLLDGQDTLLSIRQESFSFDENTRSGRHFDRSLMAVLDHEFIRLEEFPGRPFGEGEEPFDELTPDPQRPVRALQLLIGDAAGNWLKKLIHLRQVPSGDTNSPGKHQTRNLWPKEQVLWWMPAGLHVELARPADSLLLAGPSLRKGFLSGRSLVLERKSLPDGELTLEAFRMGKRARSFSLSGYWLEPGRGLEQTDMRGWTLAVPPDAAVRPFRLLLDVESGPRGPEPVLGPAGLDLERAVSISVAQDFSDKACWMIAEEGRDPVYDSPVKDSLLITRTAGRYHVQIDSTGPQLSWKKPSGKTRQRRPVVIVGVDEPSGVSHAELWIDDQPGLPRFDPDSSRLLFRPAQDLASGKHALRLIVHDKLGNTSILERSLHID